MCVNGTVYECVCVGCRSAEEFAFCMASRMTVPMMFCQCHEMTADGLERTLYEDGAALGM